MVEWSGDGRFVKSLSGSGDGNHSPGGGLKTKQYAGQTENFEM